MILRLHAGLRGSRPPGGQHARHARSVAPLARRHGTEIPWGLRPAWRRHEAAVAGREREARRSERKWVAHWKMVHIVRPVWEKRWPGQSARPEIFPVSLTRRLTRRVDAGRTGARTIGRPRLLSVALQYGNASVAGSSGGRAQPADSSATTMCCILNWRHGERRIRLSILWSGSIRARQSPKTTRLA